MENALAIAYPNQPSYSLYSLCLSFNIYLWLGIHWQSQTEFDILSHNCVYDSYFCFHCMLLCMWIFCHNSLSYFLDLSQSKFCSDACLFEICRKNISLHFFQALNSRLTEKNLASYWTSHLLVCQGVRTVDFSIM